MKQRYPAKICEIYKIYNVADIQKAYFSYSVI